MVTLAVISKVIPDTHRMHHDKEERQTIFIFQRHSSGWFENKLNRNDGIHAIDTKCTKDYWGEQLNACAYIMEQ